MKNYVLGFVFDETFNHVCMIEKQNPLWQKGKLNGIGGKVEPLESNIDAMVREMKEETDLDILASQWHNIGCLKAPDGHVEVFGAVVPNIWDAKTMTIERIKRPLVHSVILGESKTISNVPMLVKIARDVLSGNDRLSYFTLEYYSW